MHPFRGARDARVAIEPPSHRTPTHSRTRTVECRTGPAVGGGYLPHSRPQVRPIRSVRLAHGVASP
ncbi:hypothetical protein COCOBI_pt-1280 (chloroplast) [Coccomyxa sp. Obi]|nr:hypothetical protein COCOBI_pt-1280 [Coccomyxa sp. Obi]